MFIAIKRAKDTPMTYDSVPTEDILAQQVEYEKIGPNGAQIASAVAFGITGVITALATLCLLHACFQRRRARAETAKNLRPLKLLSADSPTTSSTLSVEQKPGKQKMSDPEKAEG